MAEFFVGVKSRFTEAGLKFMQSMFSATGMQLIRRSREELNPYRGEGSGQGFLFAAYASGIALGLVDVVGQLDIIRELCQRTGGSVCMVLRMPGLLESFCRIRADRKASSRTG
jgi:hypothetical protein